MHLFDAGSPSTTSRQASRRGASAALVKVHLCLACYRAELEAAVCTTGTLRGSQRALATERVLEGLQAAEGDELRDVGFASESGEHACEVCG